MRSSEDILCGRLIDRCIRPLFSEGMTMKIQVCLSFLLWFSLLSIVCLLHKNINIYLYIIGMPSN